MRWLFAVALVLLPLSTRAANIPATGMLGLTGNDTGGVIQWTPEIAHFYRAIAAEYCDRWDHKVPHITSVQARYGGFVGFRCLYDRRYDPYKWAAHGW